MAHKFLGRYPISYFWGCSSVGRALEWHSRGRQFDPDQLHTNYSLKPR